MAASSCRALGTAPFIQVRHTEALPTACLPFPFWFLTVECCPRTRREGLQRLTQLIFSKAQPKRLGPQVLTGPMLAGLAEAYVAAINNGWVGSSS